MGCFWFAQLPAGDRVFPEENDPKAKRKNSFRRNEKLTLRAIGGAGLTQLRRLLRPLPELGVSFRTNPPPAAVWRDSRGTWSRAVPDGSPLAVLPSLGVRDHRGVPTGDGCNGRKRPTIMLALPSLHHVVVLLN